MKYRIDRDSHKPAYLQLYEQLREDIVSGAFPYESRLPSKRLIAEETGVSIITAEHSFALLCDEGLAASRERRGYFVSYREGEVYSYPESNPSFLRESVGTEKTAFPFSLFARTVRKVLLDHAEGLLVKSPNAGCMELRRALSAYLARSRGIAASPEQIIIGSGAEHLYGFAVQLLGTEGGYAIEDPSYEKIEQVYRSFGVEPESLPLGKDGIQSSALWKCKKRVLHITPYRSFPSGVTATHGKKKEYLRWAAEGGCILVEDDFESEFTLSHKPEDTLFSMSDRENVIYLNTFSKTVAPSIRAGYMVLPPSLLSEFEEKLGFYSCTVPMLEQMVLAELIAGGDFERHINRVRRQKRRTEER